MLTDVMTALQHLKLAEVGGHLEINVEVKCSCRIMNKNKCHE